MEEQIIKKINGGFLSIKTGTKTPQEANVGFLLNRLKEINKPMYDEMLNNYKAILQNIKK